MAKTILRVPEGMVLTEPLRTSLHNILGAELTVEFFTETPNHLTSYQQRKQSLHDAFLFLSKAIPPQKNQAEIPAYLDWCDKKYALLSDETSEQYQITLSHYASVLCNAIAHLWSWPSKHSIAMLDKAEQYLLLQKERPSFASFVKTNPDHPEWILIVDKPLTAFTPETLGELKKIKATSLVSLNPSALNAKLLDIELEGIDPNLASSASGAPPSPHTPKDLDWFYALPPLEQILLYHSLQKINLEDPQAILFLSSRLRTIPGLANLAQHQLHTIEKSTGRPHSFLARLRSSHLGSRDVEKSTQAIQSLHTDRNTQQLLSCAQAMYTDPNGINPLLIQTLISPASSAIGPYIPMPDLFLDTQRKRAVTRLKEQNQALNIFTSNHPLNIARAYYWTPKDAPECLEILTAAEQHLLYLRKNTSEMTSIFALEQLIEEYKKTLNSGIGTAWAKDYHGRELFLSSLEDLIITSLNGVSYGSCVSGKDRKALQLMHTNAMLLFHRQYAKWPSYTDPALLRNNFIRIFVQLYHSQHYQLFSGQNAPGSDGIKTPNDYLPSDINLAILTRKLFRYDDRLASNNEIDEIVSAKEVTDKEARCLFAALQLTTTNRTLLLEQLTSLVAREEDWIKQTQSTVWSLSYFSGNMPKGITEISTILNSAPGMHEALQVTIGQLAQIYKIVCYRPAFSPNRSPITTSFYEILAKLAHSEEPNSGFESVLMNLARLFDKEAISPTRELSPVGTLGHNEAPLSL